MQLIDEQHFQKDKIDNFRYVASITEHHASLQKVKFF